MRALARGGRLDDVGSVRANVLVLCEQSRATILLRDRDPAASLARDLPLGRLHDPPGARCLACRAIVLLELAKRPAQRRSLPTSTANTARCNAGVVECPLGLLPTSRATPHHSCRLYRPREEVARSRASVPTPDARGRSSTSWPARRRPRSATNAVATGDLAVIPAMGPRDLVKGGDETVGRVLTYMPLALEPDTRSAVRPWRNSTSASLPNSRGR